MSITVVDSIDDPRISDYRNLPAAQRARRGDVFIVEGGWLVERLLASSYAVESIYVEPFRAKEYAQKVDPAVTIFVSEKKILRQVVGFDFHRCVLACGRRQSTQPMSTAFSNPKEQCLTVVLDGISDPENLGGVLRNCAAFGVAPIVLGPRCANPFSRRALRVSMGTVLKLNLLHSDDLHADLVQLKQQHGIRLVATVLEPGGTLLYDARSSQRTALLFGGEAHGLDPSLIALADERVTIPMQLETDSLNVAVASGIFLYHFAQAAHGKSP